MKTMKALVTGFAGTVGTEFTKQLLEKGYRVVGVDSNEWSVAAFPDLKGLTKRLDNFESVTDDYDLVVHCAAYKHVDLGEQNKDSFYRNNYLETLALLNRVQWKTFLFISTDKAVEPASFYGRTKSMAESAVLASGGIVARMGNVLSSSGSVIPKWEACIEKGEPLPITDPSMTRYMQPADMLVNRILSLLEKAEAGMVIVPNMGKPVKLATLVKEVLKRHGIDNYPVNVMGARPGEKKHEKLSWDEEQPFFHDLNGIILKR